MILRSVFVQCDRCSALGPGSETLAAWQLRRRARADGWTVADDLDRGEDLCPACSWNAQP